MAERTKSCKISLYELPRKTFYSVNYRIKVPNFFTLPVYDDMEYVSHSFEFACASWQFHFDSRKKLSNEADEWIKDFDVSLMRLNSEEREHTIFFAVSLLDANDKIYNDYSSVRHFLDSYKADICVEYMCSFENMNPSYDRRDTLTLIIHLMCNESPKENDAQEPLPVSREIAVRAKDCRISLLKLPKKKLSSVNYLMKVPNFFTLPEHCTQFKGPSFKFAKATWQFDCESRRKYKIKAGEWIKDISVYLTRLNSEIRKHLLFYTISLLDASDQNSYSLSGVESFVEDKKIRCLKEFHNGYASYDRRDTLTFIIQFICEDSPEVNKVQKLLATSRGVTDRERNSDISLSELPRKKLSSVNYVMKIPNFFTLPEYDDAEFKINAPSFEFAKATWQFRFESKDIDEVNVSNEEFKVFLIRLNSEVQKHSIIYVISLLNGRDENCYGGGHVYDEADSNHYIRSFSNSKLQSLFDRVLMIKTLTLSVHLICDESAAVNAIQEPFTAIRGRYIRQDFKDVLLNGENHNVTFNVKGKEFRAHQDILKARSEVFRSILSHDMLEKNNANINVLNCDPEAFEQLLLYIYTGNVESLDENNMFGLYYAAVEYNMSFLKDECREFIKSSLSVSNVCKVIQLASKHSDANLLDCATNYFTSNADDIFPTVKWQLFLAENPTVANELIIKSFKRLKLKPSS